ncbi:MAG: response regulator [Kineothrix sp.]|nr:response regulator [Kineothrix sp.]NBI90066.1 response regulator [Lachnospiraceae bacterium]
MKKRVMIVDDSRLVRVQLGDVLEGTDYEIVAYCRSGEDAIAQYDEINPDIVTMDIIMQGMDGLDASEHILRKHPDARIIMVSSLAYDDTFERAKAIGAKGFVDKPFHKEQLLKVFEQALS